MKWKVPVERISGLSPIVDRGVVYGVSDFGNLYSIDAEQGSLRWHWASDEFSAEIISSPCVDKGSVAVVVRAFLQGKHQISLYIFATESGILLKQISLPFFRRAGLFNSLALYEGIAYLCGALPGASPELADQHWFCWAFNVKTGTQQWEVDLGVHAAIASPLVANGQVYLTVFDASNGKSYVGSLHALDAQTGEEIWGYDFERGIAQESVMAGSEIVVVSASISGMDALTGVKQWNFPDLNAVENGPLAVNDELICICYKCIPSGGDEREGRGENEVLLAGGPPRIGEILAADRVSKQILWRRSLVEGRNRAVGVAISDEILCSTWRHLDIRGCSTGATLFALDAQTGRERWRFETDELYSPTMEKGVVFVQGREGENDYIYALLEE